MSEVSLFRLYLLRATYLLVAAGLGATIWPGLIDHPPTWTLWRGVGQSLLGAVALLALLGIRHPLRLLPLLLFELAWKSIWLALVALPLWSAGRLDEATLGTVRDCLWGLVIFPLAIPWPYVVAEYLRKPGDRWR